MLLNHGGINLNRQTWNPNQVSGLCLKDVDHLIGVETRRKYSCSLAAFEAANEIENHAIAAVTSPRHVIFQPSNECLYPRGEGSGILCGKPLRRVGGRAKSPIYKEVSNQFARLLSLRGIGADEMVLIGTVLRQSAVIDTVDPVQLALIRRFIRVSSLGVYSNARSASVSITAFASGSRLSILWFAESRQQAPPFAGILVTDLVSQDTGPDG